MVERALEPTELLNALSDSEAREALSRCCGVEAWIEGMLSRRPFASRQTLFSAAEQLFSALTCEQKLQAFAHHPEIGANLDELRARFQSTASLSAEEQAGLASADEATLLRLRDGNLAYRARFGYVFIVCASGKSALEMLALLEARLTNDAELEFELAAHELGKITRIRLERLTT
jgi:2-oxo-4-hydroxy-4-carboxy-5-ureidoimidazoline decarboxylase